MFVMQRNVQILHFSCIMVVGKIQQICLIHSRILMFSLDKWSVTYVLLVVNPYTISVYCTTHIYAILLKLPCVIKGYMCFLGELSVIITSLTTVFVLCFCSGSAVEVEQGVFPQLWKLEMEEWTPEQGEAAIAEQDREFNVSLLLSAY